MKRKANEFITPHKRQAALTERRNLKMARSAHAYVRGNTEKFYEWLASDSRKARQFGFVVTAM